MSWGGGGSFGGGGGGGSGGGGGGGSFGGGGGGWMGGGGTFNEFDGAHQAENHTVAHADNQQAADDQHTDNLAALEGSTHDDHTLTTDDFNAKGHGEDNPDDLPTMVLSPNAFDGSQHYHRLEIDDDTFSDLAYPDDIFKKRLAKNQFRLVKVSTNYLNKPVITIQEHKSFSSCPAYTALSWSWGTSRAAYYVQVDNFDMDIYVRPNCYAALYYLSRDTNKRDNYYWIDSICINQSDPVEKARQVSIMGHIYFQASQVVAYVGEADDTSLNLVHRAKKTPLDTVTAHDAKALLAFLRRPWFQRTWVIQEVLLARKIDLRVGCEVLPWATFEAYYNRITETAAFQSPQRHSLVHLRQWYTQQAARMLGPLRGEYIHAANLMEDLPPIGALEHAQLYRLMQSTWDFEAGLRRDKIYAILSLFSEPFPKRLEPDYRRKGKEMGMTGEFRRSDEQIFGALNVFMLENCDCQMWSIGWKGLEKERKVADQSSTLKKARSAALRAFEPLSGR